MTVKKILVPVDGSPNSQKAIEKAKELAEQYGSQIILFNVMEMSSLDYPSNPYTFSRELLERLNQESKLISTKILENAKKSLESLGERVSMVQEVGVAYDLIINYAETHDVDLIVIGSKGTSGVRNMLGSVTRKVAVGSKKSVLIVR
ncbi:universal stress protein [Parasporobacterium paucivorans]|uniref:Universal stress protein n=1 Tax=Parasporobacterium paucivorans DSM 15970 TaxID=1122934 RepID=A0A1M6KI25_9FIRM|nr:universal stress protein [Parasporobacterium paucivorans]SHJ58550.1 Nucleotide-binding universal stress protein, UspA family [Parasporobacterium paucivorans DSM 15970]